MHVMRCVLAGVVVAEMLRAGPCQRCSSYTAGISVEVVKAEAIFLLVGFCDLLNVQAVETAEEQGGVHEVCLYNLSWCFQER